MMRETEVDAALKALPLNTTAEIAGRRVTKVSDRRFAGSSLSAGFKFHIQDHDKPLNRSVAVRYLVTRAKADA
jgi:hypothetical protein